MAKKIICFMLCAGLLVGAGSSLNAAVKKAVKQKVQGTEEQAMPFNVISINPLELIVGLADGQYELRLNEASTLCIRGNYWGFKLGDWSYTAFGGGLAYRWYFKNNAPDGVYGGAVLGIASASSKYDNTYYEGSASIMAISPGLEFGNQWVWDSGFAFDLGISASYSTFTPVTVKLKDKTTGLDSNVSSTVNGFSGIGYGLRLALGYAF